MQDIENDYDVLKSVFDPAGLRIVDIGCGDGHLTRHLTGLHASVTGLECGKTQLKKAKKHPPAGNERYIEGIAQDLPLDDNSFDAAIFFYSLHHVPVDQMSNALKEAARVVKNRGFVYVAEPIASGTGQELCAPVDDETIVRDAAIKALGNASGQGLTAEYEHQYRTVFCYDGFLEFKEDMIRIDPTRQDTFETMEPELKEIFDRLGVRDQTGIQFDQPMRINVFRVTDT